MIHAKLCLLISPFVHKVFRKHNLTKLNVRFSILQVNINWTMPPFCLISDASLFKQNQLFKTFLVMEI